MTAPRWLATPLAGTAAVFAGLGLLAIPLHRLTSAEPVSARPPASAAATTAIPAVLRLRLLAPATQVRVITPDGQLLLDAREVAAGESEHNALVALDDGGLDFTLAVEFANSATATAVFLTVMPDGYEDQTRYAIGTGHIAETLRYDWHPD